MVDDNFKNLLDKWETADCTKNIARPSEVEKYFNLTRIQLDALSGRDLDYGILVVSQYLIYLCNKTGIAEAYKNYIEDAYEDKLEELASKEDITKHKTLKERSASALMNSPELKDLRSKLEMAKMRYSKIRYLIEGAKELTHSFKKILERRIKTNEYK